MTMLIADNNGIVVAMPGKRLDTNTAPEAEKMLMHAINDKNSNKIDMFLNSNFFISINI